MRKFLFDLTNRASFQWSRFPEDTDFLPKELPEYGNAVRRALCLDDESTDFPVVGALSSLLGCPWVGEKAGSLDDLRMLSMYYPPQDVWLGGILKASSSDPAVFSFCPDSWPVVEVTSLRKTGQSSAMLQNGTLSEEVSAVVNPDGRMLVDWPSTYLAKGVIDLQSDWDNGGIVEIHHSPCVFPYDAVVDTVGDTREVGQLLLQTGLASSWHAARSSMERVSLLALGLIITYRNS